MSNDALHGPVEFRSAVPSPSNDVVTAVYERAVESGPR